MAARDPRQQQLARIHMGKKQLRLDDETYRALLVRVTGEASSAQMSAQQRNAVIVEMVRLGFKAERAENAKKVWAGQPSDEHMQKPMLCKVQALLADSKRPWNYAHGLAKKMHTVSRVEWLNDHQLHSLVSAMQIDANRRKATTTTRKRK